MDILKIKYSVRFLTQVGLDGPVVLNQLGKPNQLRKSRNLVHPSGLDGPVEPNRPN